MNGWMDGWMEERMDGCMYPDRLVAIPIYEPSRALWQQLMNEVLSIGADPAHGRSQCPLWGEGGKNTSCGTKLQALLPVTEHGIHRLT